MRGRFTIETDFSLGVCDYDFYSKIGAFKIQFYINVNICFTIKLKRGH